MQEHVDEYAGAMSAAALAVADVEAEAQLTVPFANLTRAIAAEAGLGRLDLFREAQLDGIRPDFAVNVDGRPCGWVELKAPHISVDGTAWTGHQRRRQWQHLAQLDAVLVSNGKKVRLYREGELTGRDADLPSRVGEDWDVERFVALLRLFVESSPSPIRRVSALASRLAPLARMLRDKIEEGLTPETSSLAVHETKAKWSTHVHEGVTDAQFASDLAQVIAYSLAIVALEGGADRNQDRLIDLAEAQDALRDRNGVLAAALGPALQINGLRDHLDAEIGAIERLVSVVDVAAVHRSRDTRGEPWLWFYEDFLHHYDADAQRKAGVYYTPVEVVNAQVRSVDHILRHMMDKNLGFGAPSVTTLDPATGSGTYPLAVIDRAAEVAVERRGPAGRQQIAKNLADNLLAFELLPGPYAVAHLRIGQRLAEVAGSFIAPGNVRVYLTDTLDDPDHEVPTLDLWGDMEVLAEERRRAAKVKSEQPVTVVIGNPPYHRRTSESGGGWVVRPGTGRSLLDDLLDAARSHDVIFSAQASLYNDYVYFWRWAMWKAFEQNPTRPAVVSFITASSWLSGPAFVGLRELVRAHADEVWVTDLGGTNKGAIKEDNVFAIETPVAIVTMFRRGAPKQAAAAVRYTRVTGTAAEKLAAVRDLGVPGEDDAWTDVDVPAHGALVPPTGDEVWATLVPLTDVFPWQQPGAMFNRAWPIAPDRDTLRRRWRELMAQGTHDARAEAFVTGGSGRNIDTRVAGLPTLAELGADAPPRALVQYGFRSFDNEWTFEDPRLAKTESPSLWASQSDQQVYLATMATNPMGPGPALTATAYPPDKHYFANRGGKDILPLYRDSQASAPNVSAALLRVLTDTYGHAVTAPEVAAYVYAVLAHPGYYEAFRHGLATPGPRVPFTTDLALFREALDTGARLLWLHTFGERFRGPGRAALPDVPGLGWATPTTHIPANMTSIQYDRAARVLHVGDGTVQGVFPAVWEFTVSGFPVVQRWLGRRTAKGVGRAASPKSATLLDKIRPTKWHDEWNDELLDLLRVLTVTVNEYPQQALLLGRIIGGDLVDVSDIPAPQESERTVPR